MALNVKIWLLPPSRQDFELTTPLCVVAAAKARHAARRYLTLSPPFQTSTHVVAQQLTSRNAHAGRVNEESRAWS